MEKPTGQFFLQLLQFTVSDEDTLCPNNTIMNANQ